MNSILFVPVGLRIRTISMNHLPPGLNLINGLQDISIISENMGTVYTDIYLEIEDLINERLD